MDNENMFNDPNTEDADLGLPEVVEDPEEEPAVDINSLAGDDNGDDGEGDESKDEKQTQQRGTRSEPGYVQGRIAKAVQKAVAETEARLTAQFEKQLAPFREQALNAEAKELVRSGQVKDLDTAKELVRYRQGQPQEQKQDQPRNAQGQFQEKEDPATKARINMLQHQADRIKGNGGPDVTSAFKSDPDVREKVISGEWDFYDVADYLKNSQKRRAPAPMRSPNGASGMKMNAIDSMSDEQFDRMEKNIDRGVRYALK